MAHPHHHALSSVKKWGGTAEDYIDIHRWFDQTKEILGDFRHRALRHHAQGIFECERVFGMTITLSTCLRCGTHGNEHNDEMGQSLHDHEFQPKVIPVRWVGEQHVVEDLGAIPSAADWLRAIKPEPWMNRSRKLSRELEAESASVAVQG